MKTYHRIALAGVLAFVTLPAVLTASDSATPVALTPADLKWAPNPDAPGVKTAVTWGDPAKGAHGAFHKFVAGFMAPLHTHSGNNKIVVISGTMSLTDKAGKETKFPAGSFYTQSNAAPHVTRCLEGSECMIYLESDAKWDIKPVEAPKK